MVSDADYEQVLAALIEKVCELLDVESGGFMLYDPAAGELQLQRPAFGLDDDDRINVYRVPLSAGDNAVTVFLTGQPTSPTVPRTIHAASCVTSKGRPLTRPRPRPNVAGVVAKPSDVGCDRYSEVVPVRVDPHLTVMASSRLDRHHRARSQLIGSIVAAVDWKRAIAEGPKPVR
jgi:hypothetical protein